MAKSRPTAFDKEVEAYRRTTDRLTIIERHIIGEVHATFKLCGPPESLIMPTWVTVLPSCYVSIIGDLTNMIFDCHGAHSWRAALSRFTKINCSFDAYYIGQKATMGMRDFDVHEFKDVYAQEDLLQYFLEEARDAREMGQKSKIGPVTRRELWNWSDNQHELYEQLSDIGHDDYDLGTRLKGAVIGGALAMERLTRLLDEEESCPSPV